MIRPGNMVRAGGGPPMLVISRDHGGVECALIDGRGFLHVRRYELADVKLWWLTVGPKSLWPATTDAAELVDTTPRTVVKFPASSRKPRKSNKIRRASA